MAYDEHLAERISGVLKEKKVHFEARNMMGGLCYMIKDKMAAGIVKDSLMIRIDPDLYETSLKKKGCRPMDFTGKVMKGFHNAWTLIQKRNQAKRHPVLFLRSLDGDVVVSKSKLIV